jgi:hypothetical protein
LLYPFLTQPGLGSQVQNLFDAPGSDATTKQLKGESSKPQQKTQKYGYRIKFHIDIQVLPKIGL